MYEEAEKPLRELAGSEPLFERARPMTDSPGPNAPNGIKHVSVFIDIDPITNKPKDEASLEVHFYNKNYLPEICLSAAAPRDIFPISGGTRVRAGGATGQVQVTSITQPNATQSVLKLVVKPIGDYSTYTLGLSTVGMPNTMIDPLFSEIRFKFRPGCFNNNCAPEWEAALPPIEEPVIDYRAKDYGSFRQAMITAMSSRVPGWQPTSEADLDMVLAELFSVAADELSDYQDRVMNEAYFASARKRVSTARHARLMDYHIHQGSQASTWLALEIGHDASITKLFKLKPEPGAGKVLKSWAGDSLVSGGIKKETESSVVFIMRNETQIHQYLNNIGLYTWSNTITALKAGSTWADLRLDNDLYLDNLVKDHVPLPEAEVKKVRDLINNGIAKYLLIQEHLNPRTGKVNGRNPAKRQFLKLIPGKAEVVFDPISIQPEWILRVRWEKEDALRYDYCFTIDCPADNAGTAIGTVDNVSLFHGNLVEVFHGRQQTTIFKDEGKLLDFTAPDKPLQFHYEHTRWGAICRLPEVPLAYRQTKPGGDVPPVSTLAVTVNTTGNDPWDEMPNLIHSDDSAENGDHFAVETDENRRSVIRFGNGRNGRELLDGAEVTCTYQYGMPLDGNLGADRIVNFDGSTVPNPLLQLRACWNPFDVTNGIDREPVVENIRRVPEAYRQRQLRAVTLADYIARAEEIPGVSRASARYAWTGSWRTVCVTIDPVGTNELSYKLRKTVADYLNAFRLIGEDLEIRPPVFVPLDINVVLCAKPDVWPEDIKFVLEQEFSAGWTPDGRKGFFHPDEWTFGQSLHASQIIGRAIRVNGVEHAVGQKVISSNGERTISVSIKRWNSPVAAADAMTQLNYNEIIQVMNDPDHMEQGSIKFSVKGGRR